jgi:hypothetical protein
VTKLADLMKSFGMETGQVFILTVIALAYFSDKGASAELLKYITWLGLAFIVGEKLRAAIAAWRQ